jgi:hypothetical protein
VPSITTVAVPLEAHTPCPYSRHVAVMPLSSAPPPSSRGCATDNELTRATVTPLAEGRSSTSPQKLLPSLTSVPPSAASSSSLPHATTANTRSDNSIPISTPKAHASIPTTTPYPSTERNRATVVFWPIQEPLRALWDPEGRLGFGWVDCEDPHDRVKYGGSTGSGEVGQEKEEGVVHASGSTETLGAQISSRAGVAKGHGTKDASTESHPSARKRTTVCVAGVFPSGMSLEEARDVLQRVVDEEEKEKSGSRLASGLGERVGKDLGEDEEEKQVKQLKGERGSGMGRRDSKPEVFDLGQLRVGGDEGGLGSLHGHEGEGEGETEERRTQGKKRMQEGRRDVQIVLYDRYESGSLRYWEVDGSTSSSGLDVEVDGARTTREREGGHGQPRGRIQGVRRQGKNQTLTYIAHHLNASPRLADRVRGKRVRMYRPAAAVVLAVFGAVLRPVLSVLARVILGSARNRPGKGKEGESNDGKGRDTRERIGKEGDKGGIGMREMVVALGRTSAVVKQVRVRAGQVDGLLRGVDELTRTSGTWEGSAGVKEYVGVYNRCVGPIPFPMISGLPDGAGMRRLTQREYVNRFFNALWLILNDLTLGVAVGGFLVENAGYLARVVDAWVKVSVLTI